MKLGLVSELERQAVDLLKRDHEADITRLNAALAKKDRESAGLEISLPPVLFTGNPFKLTPGECVALIGINPRYQKPGQKKSGGRIEYPQLVGCVDRLRKGDVSLLDEYIDHRASFFDINSQMYYGKYFTGLGKLLSRHLGIGQSEAEPRSLFRKHVFKADALPWFSEDADAIDFDKLASCRDECWIEYYSFLTKMLGHLRPRWIQCNGKSSGKVLSAILGISLDTLSFTVDGKRQSIQVGWAAIAGTVPTPILVHTFLSSVRVNHDGYGLRMAKIWREWLVETQPAYRINRADRNTAIDHVNESVSWRKGRP